MTQSQLGLGIGAQQKLFDSTQPELLTSFLQHNKDLKSVIQSKLNLETSHEVELLPYILPRDFTQKHHDLMVKLFTYIHNFLNRDRIQLNRTWGTQLDINRLYRLTALLHSTKSQDSILRQLSYKTREGRVEFISNLHPYTWIKLYHNMRSATLAYNPKNHPPENGVITKDIKRYFTANLTNKIDNYSFYTRALPTSIFATNINHILKLAETLLALETKLTVYADTPLRDNSIFIAVKKLEDRIFKVNSNLHYLHSLALSIDYHNRARLHERSFYESPQFSILVNGVLNSLV